MVLHSALKENPEVDHINEKFYSWMKIHTLLEKFCRISLYVPDDAIAIDVTFSNSVISSTFSNTVGWEEGAVTKLTWIKIKKITNW